MTSDEQPSDRVDATADITASDSTAGAAAASGAQAPAISTRKPVSSPAAASAQDEHADDPAEVATPVTPKKPKAAKLKDEKRTPKSTPKKAKSAGDSSKSTDPKKAGKKSTAKAKSKDTATVGAQTSSVQLPVATTPPARRGPLVAASAAAVALLAAAIVLGVLYVQARNKDSGVSPATRQQALASAQKVAIDFSTYDYRHLDQNFAQVASELTGKFATDYQATARSLKATLMQYQAVATAKVLDAGLVSISANKAVAILFVDQTTTGKVSKTPTVDRNRLRVTMERHGNRWLTSALDLR